MTLKWSYLVLVVILIITAAGWSMMSQRPSYENIGSKVIRLSSLETSRVFVTEAIPHYERGSDVEDYTTAFDVETYPVVNGQVEIPISRTPVFIECEEPGSLQSGLPKNLSSTFGIEGWIVVLRPMFEEGMSEQEVEQFLEERIQTVLDVGIGVNRVHPSNVPTCFTWNVIDPDLDGRNFDFHWQDLLVKKLQETGIDLLISLSPDSNWEEDESYPPSDDKAYQRFVEAVVERYDGDGKDDMPGLKWGIKLWQLDNEPDLRHKVRGRFPPEDYFYVLKLTSEAVKKADPDAIMILGPCAGSTQMATDSKGYFQDVMNLGAKEYIDAVSIHFYPLSYRIEEIRSYFDNMTAVFGEDMPIYVTEAGEAVRYGFLPQNVVPDQRKAAESVIRNYVYILINYPAEKIFPIGHTGGLDIVSMKNPQISGPSLAKFSYKLLIEKLGDMDWRKVEKIKDGEDNLYLYKCPKKGSSKSIYVAWWDYFAEHPNEDLKITSHGPQLQPASGQRLQVPKEIRKSKNFRR